MLELDQRQKVIIKKFFNTGGYVFNFSTKTFDAFTFSSIGIKLCEKYKVSKGRSFEQFIDESNTKLIILLTKDLLDYYDVYKFELPENMIKRYDYEQVKKIIVQFDYLLPIVEDLRYEKDKKGNGIAQLIKKYDVFISHASKDKLVAVNDIQNELISLGINVWCDTDKIGWGDSLTKKIEEGLSNCEFGIIVISRTFFTRNWCNKELESLLKRQNKEKQNIILPLLLNVTLSEAIEKYPFLEDIKMIEYIKGQEKDIALLFCKIFIQKLKNLIRKNN